MRRLWEGGISDVEFLPVRDKEHPFPHLRNAVENRVEKGITADVALAFAHVEDLLGDDLPAVVQHVGHILHEEGQGLKYLDIVEVRLVVQRPGVVKERFRMHVHVPESSEEHQSELESLISIWYA